MEYIRRKVTLKKSWEWGLERLRLQEDRTGYRAKNKVLKKEIEQNRKKEKNEGEKGPGKQKIHGKTRKAMKFGIKYLGETNTLQRKKTQGKTKKLRALPYLCSHRICTQ